MLRTSFRRRAGSLALLTALSIGAVSCSDNGSASTDPQPDMAGAPGPGVVSDPLPATRLLRRLYLTLAGRTPTAAEYDTIMAASTEAERIALVDAQVDKLLAAPEFYDQLVSFGHDWLRVSAYINGADNEGRWRGDRRAVMVGCGAGTKRAGALVGLDYTGTQSPKICDDQNADGSPMASPVVNTVTPWWDPSKTVTVLGRAGTGVTKDPALPDPDCAHVSFTIYEGQMNGGKCSCGPNLIYCFPDAYSTGANSTLDHNDPRAAARQVWEEPARLLAHLGWYDRPLSDLVLGNYSVGPSALQATYVGLARGNLDVPTLDSDDSWWNPAKRTGLADPGHMVSDPLAWREFVVESRHPALLSLAGNTPSGELSRTYQFDPRTQTGGPKGVPAAGVLTMASSWSSFPRERVRAARWLEMLACRNFVPPPSTSVFNTYVRDPAREGSCQYCHTTIDPAAIHFKRWSFDYPNTSILMGIGKNHIANYPTYSAPRVRFDQDLKYDTMMTPVSQAQLMTNPDAALIDFLPPDQHLFGQTSDGTIGPLGFAKMLVQSGEFDRCVTQRLYQHVVGRRLDPTKEEGYIGKLTADFVADKRVLRAFVKKLVQSAEFRRGL